MIVWLSKDVYIKADDGCCFTLMQRFVTQKGDNPGAIRHKSLGYYSDLGQAAVGALKRAVIDTEGELQIKELIEVVQRSQREIVAACSGVGTASQAAAIKQSFRSDALERLLDFDGDES